jgi:hypothetical protein
LSRKKPGPCDSKASYPPELKFIWFSSGNDIFRRELLAISGQLLENTFKRAFADCYRLIAVRSILKFEVSG